MGIKMQEPKKKKKNEDSLRLEHKIYVLYTYVYENNFPKDFHLNQGFKEHCVKKWDTYMKKRDTYMKAKVSVLQFRHFPS